MTARRGILTIAHTNPKYARQAVALARSIRLRDPDIPLAVATNLHIDLFEGMFDVVVRPNVVQWNRWLSKLDAYEFSPFEETLFVDSDCLALDTVSRAFAALGAMDFGVFGRNVSEDYWRFVAMDEMRRLTSSATYPSFNSGVIFFRRSAVAVDVFRLAKEMSLQYDALGMRRLNGHMNDEPLFSAAMARMGLRACEDESKVVHAVVPHSLFGIGSDIDVFAGRGSALWNGRRARPIFLHFSGVKSTHLPYTREAARLAAAFRFPRSSAWMRRWIGVRTLIEWAGRRIRRRLAA